MGDEITITIDGQTVKTQVGTNLITLAKTQGVEIPHYCFHQALPVAGNCRICFVEIDGMKEPQIACNAQLKDGMVVHTKSPKALEARKWTLEFLLANHPLDCPICDKAGECELQNYTYKYGKTHTDFNETKRRPATVKLSDRLWIEKDRCIVCLRCVQFLQVIAGKEELYVKQRGNQAEITTAPGKEVESDYQLNTVDICPVGALTSNNFRYAERVWNLKKADSICPLCPRGCSTHVEFKDNIVHRVTPRFNQEVNGHWMCDAGRTYYKEIQQHKPRLVECRNHGVIVNAEVALRSLADAIASQPTTLVLLSNWLCNEDIEPIAKFFQERLSKVTFSGPEFVDGGDHLLKRHDFGPNAPGLRALLGKRFSPPKTLKADFEYCVSFGVNPSSLESTLEYRGRFDYFGAYQDDFVMQAELSFPTVAHGEIEGSYTNFQGVVQSFSPFLETAPSVLSIDEWLEKLSAAC